MSNIHFIIGIFFLATTACTPIAVMNNTATSCDKLAVRIQLTFGSPDPLSLFYALKNCDLDFLRYLVKRTEDTQVISKRGNDDSLVLASELRYGDTPRALEIAKILINYGADINAIDTKGNTPFYISISSNPGLARLLLQHGADVHKKSNNGQTTLMAAARNHDAELVNFLLEKGIDVNAQDNEGMTALMAGLGTGQLNDVKITSQLLKAGADVNLKINDLGVTALHRAASGGIPENIQLLIGAGAEVEAKTNELLSPLHYAAYHHQVSAAEELLKNGAEVEAKSSQGWTPLASALMSERFDPTKIVKLLVNNGADINAKSKNNWTILHFIIQKIGTYQVHGMETTPAQIEKVDNALRALAEWAISNGANVNLKDSFSITPLVYAMIRKDRHLVLLLIKNGADVNLKSLHGKTPLSLAVRAKSETMAEILRQHGAKLE